MNYYQSDILSVHQFNKDSINQLFDLTLLMNDLRQQRFCQDLFKGYVLGNLFFEASTRSRMSFSSAFLYLGGTVNSTTGVVFSSISKGETLADTIKVISSYCDVLVIRHSELGAAQEASNFSSVPVINAGDGPGEHPTQALLDLFTIYKEKKRLDNFTITMVGDLRFGRTVHSLAKLLCLYSDITFNFVAPEVVQMPEQIVADIRSKGFTVNQTSDLESVLPSSDVIYSTRIQKERFSDSLDYSAVDGCYVLTADKLKSCAKSDVCIMHPLPRTNEIDVSVDSLPQAAYFRQAENGLYVRMALFTLILGKEELVLEASKKAGLSVS